MKKKILIALSCLFILVSCSNEKLVFTHYIDPFGYNESTYLPIDLKDDGTYEIKNSIIYPFNTQVYFRSYIFESEKKEFEELIKEASNYMIKLSVCFDRHNLYLNENGDIIKNLAYLNMHYGSSSYVELEKETYDLLKIGVELTKLTEGKFNIFIGELSSLWDDFIKGGNEFPLETEIMAAKNNIPTIDELDNIVTFNDENNSVLFNKIDDRKISITFGGIAKGRASDLLNNTLDGKRILFSGGQSSIATYGDTFFDTWSMGIKNPKYGNFSDMHYLLYERQGKFSLSTSGDYQNFRMYQNNKYHHIIDPSTGYPSSSFNSVTVVGECGVYADALTTALMMMDLDDGMSLINKVNNEKKYTFSPIFIKEENNQVVAYASKLIENNVALTENSDMGLVFF